MPIADPVPVNVVVTTLTEERVRQIIREELARRRTVPVVQPVIRPGTPYYPSYPQPYVQPVLPWWQNPVICGVSVAADTKEYRVTN